MTRQGRLVDIGDTRLFVVEVGQGLPLLILHGGPGLDHHMFGDYLDPLGQDLRLIFVDQRAQGRSERAPPETWSLAQMARDVGSLGRALDLSRYAVLGHSYGAFVALQHAVDFPGEAAQTIVSGGIPSARYLERVARELEAFEPVELRDQVAASWARESSVETEEDFALLMREQLPFHFADPRDPRIEEYARQVAATRYAPAVLAHLARREYGGIEVEERLQRVTQPVLVLAGRHDRTCSVEAAAAIAANVRHGTLLVFEQSGHMAYVEENARYLEVVRRFLERPR
jgi:proline iminopeptidase